MYGINLLHFNNHRKITNRNFLDKLLNQKIVFNVCFIVIKTVYTGFPSL